MRILHRESLHIRNIDHCYRNKHIGRKIYQTIVASVCHIETLQSDGLIAIYENNLQEICVMYVRCIYLSSQI